MKRFKTFCILSAAASMFFVTTASRAQRVMENLDRGVVAINQGEGRVFVSWRMLGTEPDAISYNLYRTVGTGQPVKLTAQPMTTATCFQDSGVDTTQPVAYTVRAVLSGQEQPPSKAFTIAANAPAQPYLSVPVQTPAGYTSNDASVADLDGDGQYELIVHMTGRGRDNSAGGETDAPILHAYKLDGTLMWTINLGKNIREGAHYTQFMVADFDGDGKAEMFVKTADGTVDGVGKVIGDPNADWVAKEGSANHRDTTGSARGPDGQIITNPDGTHVFTYAGRVLSGPEYLTVFDGMTGAALATTDYVPGLGKPETWTEMWGDAYGNRSERYLAAVAYLDGKLPSAVMCRGYYHRATLAAWDWRDGKLTRRWLFDSKDGTPGNERYGSQGNHGLSVADVDQDGRDEIIYGACVIDDNGKGLYSTGLGHGDAMHVTDMLLDRPGLEVFSIHENPRHSAGHELRDAKTGEILWSKPGGEGRAPDVGRGVAFDVDPRHPGYEMWSSLPNLYNAKGEVISTRKPTSVNFGVWWDGDLLREMLNGNTISKFEYETGNTTPILRAENCVANNGSKSTPTLSADILGDWREEVIWRTQDSKELRIYTTTIPTEHRIYTLMHDPQYRAAIAWQNVAYNQPPHPGFFLGAGMQPAPRPNITFPGATQVR
jgi:rhamnogalacturonan endolyase